MTRLTQGLSPWPLMYVALQHILHGHAVAQLAVQVWHQPRRVSCMTAVLLQVTMLGHTSMQEEQRSKLVNNNAAMCLCMRGLGGTVNLPLHRVLSGNMSVSTGRG